MNDAKTKPDMKPVQQHILTGFRIIESPDKSQAAIAFRTRAGGRHHFIVNQQTILGLAKALVEHARKMPRGAASKKDPQDWFDA